MKLQLDENTLNAYINEAIKQELNEDIFGQSKLRYRVDFNAMNEAVGEPAKADFINKAINGGEKVLKRLGINPDVLKTTKSALNNGTFGEEDSFDFSFKDGIRVGHVNQGKRQRNNFVKALRDLGYSNQQIHDAIVKSMRTLNGPIYLGTNETGQFIPYEYKKNRKGVAKGDLVKAFEKLWNNLDDAIINPENYPEPEGDGGSPEKDSSGWDWLDGAKEKGKNWLEHLLGGSGMGSELIMPDNNDKNVDWSNPQGINYNYEDDERRHGPNAPSVVDDGSSNTSYQASTGNDGTTAQQNSSSTHPTQTTAARNDFPWDTMSDADIQWTSPEQQTQTRLVQNTTAQTRNVTKPTNTTTAQRVSSSTAPKNSENAGDNTTLSTASSTPKQVIAQQARTAEHTPTKTTNNGTNGQTVNSGIRPNQFWPTQKETGIKKPEQTLTQSLVQSAISNMGKAALNKEKPLKERLENVNLLSTRVRDNLYKLAREGKMTMDQAKYGAKQIKQAEKTIRQNLPGYEN